MLLDYIGQLSLIFLLEIHPKSGLMLLDLGLKLKIKY